MPRTAPINGSRPEDYPRRWASSRVHCIGWLGVLPADDATQRAQERPPIGQRPPSSALSQFGEGHAQFLVNFALLGDGVTPPQFLYQCS